MPEITLHRDGRADNVEIAETGAEATPLVALSKTTHRPENPDLDIRGYLMFGSDGEAVGRVEDLLLEADRRVQDRGEPLFHTEYAVVRYTEAAGTRQWVLVPMAFIKETLRDERKVVMRIPAKEACEQAYTFRAPDDITPEGEQEVYTLWELTPRWERSGRGPRILREDRR